MLDFINKNGFVLVQMTVAAVLALSLYLPLMAGQLSLASPGFYALGGYIAAVMSTKIFPPTPDGQTFPIIYMVIEMVIAGIASGALALMVGLPALRLRGIYLALATIAFVEIMRVLALNLDVTGKAIGIFGIPQPFVSKTQVEYLAITIPLLLLAALFVYRLERVRVGRAFIALREDELAAAAMGINPTYYKVLAFVMGAVLAGVIGAVYAHVLNTWNARQGTFDASILVLAYVIIGGSRTYLGPIAGGLLLTALPEVLRAAAGIQGLPTWLAHFLQDGRLIIFGLLIAIGTIFFPQGLITPNTFRQRKTSDPVSGQPKADTQPEAGAS
ncbi:MAG TPA: branched-chain amino acid ABC transporter permease [Phototrophicaceae bacterium]|nr:branched-chain amino acid ABC transporter permease [Phototrophicaceae bacterium]